MVYYLCVLGCLRPFLGKNDQKTHFYCAKIIKAHVGQWFLLHTQFCVFNLKVCRLAGEIQCRYIESEVGKYL